MEFKFLTHFVICGTVTIMRMSFCILISSGMLIWHLWGFFCCFLFFSRPSYLLSWTALQLPGISLEFFSVCLMFILNRKCSFIWYNNSFGSISMPTCSGAWAIPPHVQLLAFPFVGLYEDSPLQEHGCLADRWSSLYRTGCKNDPKTA